MNTKSFNINDVLGYGWRVMKANFGFFIAVGFIWLIIGYIPTIIQIALRHLSLPNIIFYTVATILSWTVSIILGIGLMKIALSFCDEQKPKLSTLFDAFDCFWRYLGTLILYLLIVYAGGILLFIPGIIWAIKFSLCFYFVVDKGLGPIQALKASSRTTMTVKWDLLALYIICALINMLGMLCLVVGILAAYPITIIANALVYRQLLAQTPQLDEFGIGATNVQPNPNWTPTPDQQ